MREDTVTTMTDKKKEDTKPAGANMRSTGSRPAPFSFSPGQRSPRNPTKPEESGKSKDSENIAKILEKLDNIDSTNRHLSDRIDGSNVKVDQVMEETAKVKATTTGIKTQVTVHSLRLSELENRIEQLECEKRKTTLVIDGLEEGDNEDLTDLVDAIFRDVGVDYNTRVCVNIYRRGRRARKHDRQEQQEGPKRPRPVVVVFLRQTEKAQFFRNLKNLKGKDQWKNVYFNDDLTELQQIEQRDLRSLVAYAKKVGKEASVRAGAFWYEGRKYRYDELHRLPLEITLLKAKTLSILDDTALVFQSPHSPLSNLYPCNLLYRGICFLSAEGAFQYSRALTSGYEKEAEQIKTERNPYKAKKLGSLLRSTPVWDEICESVMLEILKLKFSAIEFCKEFLLSSGTKKLFEGTGDRRWGCGIPISKYWLITPKCPGKNILGQLLETTRDDIQPK